MSQPAPPPPEPLSLDPDAPPAPDLDPGIEPWPDLGLDWPDLEAPDALPPPEAQPPGAPPPGPPPAEPPALDSAARPYSWAIDWVAALEDDTALLTQFRALSALEEHRREPANAAQIDRRARADAELLAELLRAFGYYDAQVSTRVEMAGSALAVILTAEPGPLYRFAAIALPGLDAALAEDAAALHAAFGLAPESPVEAARVEASVAALRAELGRRGYAFAEVGEPELEVDHDTRTAALTLPVQPGGARRFGRILVEDGSLFSAAHIATIARFEEGDPWRVALVEDLRQALVATGLVSAVTIRPVARSDSDLVDLAIALERAPMRTIAGEAGYGSGEGVRIEASWQHRNLIPPEGAVTFRGIAGTREQLLSAIYRRSNFRRRDQVLAIQATVAHVDRPAFRADTAVVAAGIERQSSLIFQKDWTWSLGIEFTATDERDVDVATGTIRDRTFFIAALPAFLGYDGSNDLLDPTSGFRLSARISPEASLQAGSFFYLRAQLDGSFYRPLSPTVTLAARARLGAIVGAERDRIAPSRRFYAGGGGSVRGYGFQALGPRDPVFNDPIGGRSLAEFAIEARIRVGNFGIVPFIDAGNISTTTWPRFDNLRFGAGLGVRYHTRFGPIRVDVGTPLNRAPGDERIAVYVSLGQAF